MDTSRLKDQRMSRRNLIFTVLLVLLAVMVFAEAIFSNFGTLLNEQARTELQLAFGLTSEAYTLRLVLLATFDLVAGVGCVLGAMGIVRGMVTVRRVGGVVAFVGFGMYCAYQLAAVITYLPEAWDMPVAGAAVVYLLLGAGAWYMTRTAHPHKTV
jgi:hypothetical protein